MVCSWMFSVALIQLSAVSETCPGPSSMTSVYFVTHFVVQSSFVCKIMVVDGVNLWLDITDSAMSVQSLKSPSGMRCIICVAIRAANSEDFFDEYEPIGVQWFGDIRSQSGIMC